MNPGQLSAFFNAHKVEVLGAAGAGVVLLALRSRKKTAGAPVAAAQPAGTLPAAAVVPANGLQGVGSAYDSSAYDVYSALQSELTPFLQAQAAQTSASSGVSSVPALPIASTIFAPLGTGHYVINGNGTEAEVESDGSLYGMQGPEFKSLYDAGARATASVPNDVRMYSIGDNLKALQSLQPATTPAAK